MVSKISCIPTHIGEARVNTWQVETSGNTMLVVRRHLRKEQDIARKPNGRIWWFESRDLAQIVADQLNAKSVMENPE